MANSKHDTDSYKNRLKNYLLWATMESVGTSGSTKAVCKSQSHDGLSAEEVMYRFETFGENKHSCTDVSRLYRYVAGKNIRDFYVSNWVKDVRDGTFVAEEFLCVGGMDVEEFVSVFKRFPDPWLLRRMWRAENAQQSIVENPTKHNWYQTVYEKFKAWWNKL